MEGIKFGVALIVLVAFIVLVVQNLSTVAVKFLTSSKKLSLAVPIVAAYLVGGFTARSILCFLNDQRKLDKKTENAGNKAAQRELVFAC